MKKITAALATIMLGLSLTVALSSPAQATTCFLSFCKAGFVIHGSDDGYDDALIVICAADDPVRHYVQEGSDSDSDCAGEHHDMNAVVLRADEEWWCENADAFPSTKVLTFDAPGRHAVSDDFSEKCVLHRD